MNSTQKINILLIEDETEQRQILKSILIEQHYQVSDVGNGEQGIKLIQQQTFDIVISDWKLPGVDGVDVLNTLKQYSPLSSFILITAHGDASHAIATIRAGADDYLLKPFDKTTLLFTIKKQLYAQSVERENQTLKQQLKQRKQLVDIIGRSPLMNQLFQRIEKAAPTNATIMINGESGTGKELAARAIHQLSSRSNSAFIPVNCAAIPESLAESELFGVEKGAFTGATRNRPGVLEAANGGTIFLDEIGELPLLMQSKLLRFLQEGTINRVGSTAQQKLDVRVVSATNRNLILEIEKGNFREDLYYRLNVIPVTIPPLRNRPEDILPLIEHFIQQCCDENNILIRQLSKPAIKLLLSYHWPGNVRELKNIIERSVLLSSEEIISVEEISGLEFEKPNQSSSYLLPENGLNWEDHEKDCLLQSLAYCNNNKTQAAKLLGLNYKAFLYRLEKYSIC
ncbi:sigma-54-dependent transcriptional regulator [Aliikangiella maris]|uniref:Sigma-54 dependent transcriptional regulator n=2 Tax=Aliikangiella maris TaxID=3162458 RepID=A0ABV2BUL2_9GAMM